MIWIFKLLFKIKGWKFETESIYQYQQSIVLAAPHTSNWDAVLSLAAFSLMGLKVRFTVKHDWFKFPFKRMMTNLGGIAIDRRPKKEGEQRLSMVDAMVNLFKENKNLHIMITPEGTRSLRTEWKTGFYHVAHQAKVPILCGYLDYKRKVAGIGKVIDSNLPLEVCMQQMMDFYKTIHAKFPEKFSVDKRYA